MFDNTFSKRFRNQIQVTIMGFNYKPVYIIRFTLIFHTNFNNMALKLKAFNYRVIPLNRDKSIMHWGIGVCSIWEIIRFIRIGVTSAIILLLPSVKPPGIGDTITYQPRKAIKKYPTQSIPSLEPFFTSQCQSTVHAKFRLIHWRRTVGPLWLTWSTRHVL